MSNSKIPCNFDHNGECLICDCWAPDCAWMRLKNRDFKYESEEELKEMFKEFIEKPEPPKTRVIHYPGLFEFTKDWDIDIPWSIVLLTCLGFLIAIFYV